VLKRPAIILVICNLGRMSGDTEQAAQRYRRNRLLRSCAGRSLTYPRFPQSTGPVRPLGIWHEQEPAPRAAEQLQRGHGLDVLPAITTRSWRNRVRAQLWRHGS
jgi:hypothetical protein